ncbi:MAG: DUF1080 domain-containing protein [Pirellulaceae bacterium]|nr:DUF1080 domain-containing protein [Pirellulaceae bacterium]
MLRRMMICAALLAFALTANAEEKKTAKPLRGLLIAGGCCHDYPNQNEIITQGLSQRANIEWEVFHGLKPRDRKLAIYQTDHWTTGYDVVVHNECYGGVQDVELVERIVKGHSERGVPLVVIHCSMHSYRNARTDEWRKLLGVTSKRHERGGRQLDVVNRAPQHPIMKHFPGSWRTPNGELYVIEKTWANCQPLATAYGQDTQQDQPVIWTNEYGKAKLFGTTLGHHNETMMSDEWLDVVARGTLWVCGKLQDDGTPQPGYEGSGEAPIKLPGVVPQLVGAVALGQPTPASWADTVPFPAAERPIELFNGKNLAGWNGQAEYFSVEDGEIVARNGKDNPPAASTYLMSKKNFSNFRLVFEGRLVTSKMHSGIALWGKPIEKQSDPYSYQGHLVMFPSGWGFWDLYRRNSIYQDDGRAKAADNQGWNQMEILAIGPRIRLAVNGQEVADWTDPQPAMCQPGPIGLQLHSNKISQEVRWRGLRLSENPEERLITIKD